jgi:hypothetical protein
MSTSVQRTTQLGELVAAAFDRASASSADPQEVSQLAAETLERMLRRAGKTIRLAKLQHRARVPLVGPGSGSEVTLDGEDRIRSHEDDVLPIVEQRGARAHGC